MLIAVSQLRKQLRKARRQISAYEQKQSEHHILRQLIRQPEFKNSQHIGIYLHAFGEIQTRRIIEHCFQHHKNVYLPKICNMNQHLSWVRISQHQYRTQRFSLHRLGMREPVQHRGVHVSKLQLLLLPLLACDAYGTRIGMGGGFYDRTLSTAPKAPFRMGLAHELQLIPQRLPREKWDQTLDALLTPQRLLRFKR